MEELCENVEHLEKYDAVIASEVLEHVNNVDTFILNIAKFIKVKIHFRRKQQIYGSNLF